MEFFCKHEFLRYQEPEHRYYKELLNICSLRIYPAPDTELSEDDQRFTEANSPSNKSPLKKINPDDANRDQRVPRANMHLTHISFVLSGALIAREKGVKTVTVQRYEEGDCICNEQLINTKVPLASAAIDLNMAEGVVLAYMLGKGIITMNT
jgi:hypothetical protein